MKTSSCLERMRLWVCLAGMAVLGASGHAQTTVPVPNFQLSWHPQLYFNLMPADFNEDGVTDIVTATRGGGQPQPADLVVMIGRGNGMFFPVVSIGLAAVPLAAEDMNGDGFADIVAWTGAPTAVLSGTVVVLAGNGDGTFDPAREVAVTRQESDLRAWGAAADFDGDRYLDVLVPDHDEQLGLSSLKLYHGNGDFTFDAPVELPLPEDALRPHDVTVADFNGDGRRDIALPMGIIIFLNQGNRAFVRSAISNSAAPYTDLTSGDLNGDGRIDLIASWGDHIFFYPYVEPGGVHVFLGNGNGTFQPRVPYDTGVRGEASVVAGDFNGDGKLDVATGNRSQTQDDDVGLQLWDSVSILPGDATGRLLKATTYSLATVNPLIGNVDPNYPFQAAHHQLTTADLNGDRRADLIASPGVTLLNRPPAANRPPTVFAGLDRTEYYFDVRLFLNGEAGDPDMHWLTYTWTNESGAVIGRLPSVAVSQERGTTHTYTLTVDDGQGGVARDSVTVRVPLESDPFIDFLRPTGVAIQSGVPYRVEWAISDDTSFASLSLSYSLDDGRTFAPVPGCQNLQPSVRQCTWANPGPPTTRARLRLIARNGGDWIVNSLQFRIVTGPPLPEGWTGQDIGSVGAAGTTTFSNGTWRVEGSGADIWGTADEFRYVYRGVAANFSFVARVANIENLHRWVKAGIMIREDLSPGARHVSLFATPRTERGLALQRRLYLNGISEHTAGPAVAPPVWLKVGRVGDTISAYYRTSLSQTWTLVGRQTVPVLRSAVYVGLAVSSHVDGALATAVFDNVAVEPHPITETWDIGAVGVPGTTTFDGVVYQMEGSGADIWGTADAFRFALSRYYGSGSVREVSARVRDVENTHRWAKAGVMFRETVDPGARHVMVVVSAGRGVAMQYRSTTNGLSAQAGVLTGVAPEWVRLSRTGDTFTGYASEDGVTWHTIGNVTIQHMFAEPGLAVTSHNNATLASASFEDLVLIRFQ
jgi:hypothetical protein